MTISRVLGCLVALTMLFPAMVTPAMADQQVPVDYDRIAAQVAQELAEMPLGPSRDDWRKRVANASWRERRGARPHWDHSVRSEREPQPRGLWCAVATDTRAGMRRDAVFYGLRPEQPYACRLELVRMVVDDAEGVSAYFDAFVKALDTRVGKGEKITYTTDPPEMGAGPEMLREGDLPRRAWDDNCSWSRGARLFMLTRSRSTIQLIVQSQILSASLSEPPEPHDAVIRRYGVDLTHWEVAHALRSIDADAAELLLTPYPYGLDQPRVEAAIERLLDARPSAKARDAAARDRRALLTLAAGLIVPLLEQEIREDSEKRPLPQLAPHGIKMGYGEHGGATWRGESDLADQVRLREPHTRWGELAFLAKLSSGWADGGEGTEYRDVIREGRAWLLQHPQSPLAVYVMSHVARAYDTWWSLSLGPPIEDWGFDPAEHQAGAAEARLEAIRWYERLLAAAPTSAEAEHARRVLVLLHAGVDTGERVLHIVYA